MGKKSQDYSHEIMRNKSEFYGEKPCFFKTKFGDVSLHLHFVPSKSINAVIFGDAVRL